MMSNGDRSLFRYNKDFVKCFSIAIDRKRFQHISQREVQEKNIPELCHAINKMHENELKCGGQNLWYITAQLLVGTVLYHQRQVDFVHEETRLLQQKFLSGFVFLRKTQTIKRRTREICTKSKRKRLVDEEITTNVFVWNSNEFKQADENDNHLLSELDKPDPCMRPQEEITLHEPDNINEDDRREHNMFSQINDFGEICVDELANVMPSPSEGNLSVSEIAASVFSAANDQQPIEMNAMNEMNIDEANADGERMDSNDISCESIPPSPIFPMNKYSRKTFRKRIATPEIDVMREKTPLDGQPVRESIQPVPKAICRNLSILQASKSIPSSPISKRAILWPDDSVIFASQLTDDNNNPPTPNVDDNFPTHQKAIDDNSELADVDEGFRMSAETARNAPARLEPDDDFPVGIVSPTSPIAPEVDSVKSNVDDLVLPSPPNLEPIDIKPPLLEFSEPLSAVSKRKRRSAPKKKKRMICVDDVITLDSTGMRARIQNVTVDCKRQRADIVSTAEKFLHKEQTFFTEPTMFGQCHRKFFKRNLVQNSEKYDSSIIKAILDSLENGRPDSVENREREVIDGDTTPRTRGRKRKPRHVESLAHQQPKMAHVDEAAMSTPVPSINGFATELTWNSFVMDIPLPDDSRPVDQHPKNTPMRIDENLNENDEMVLRKLKRLWKQNVYPVAMTNITPRKSSRLQAARNFASILSLKKLRLVELEADESGQMKHIAEGHADASQNIQ